MDKPIYLVAGASSGMGRRTALYLAEHGAHVVVASRREDACEEVAAQIAKEGGSATARGFDGTDAQSAADLIDWIEKEFGTLDGSFNNLGHTVGDGPLDETSLERWQESIAINLSAVFHLMRAEIPLLIKNGGGAIVNNSSTGGLRGTRNMSDYSAAKWGLIGLTKSAAVEYASQGLRINAIAPGIIETEKFKRIEENIPHVFEKLRTETPIGRFGDMAEIAETVRWLLADAPGYLNGTVIPVDGGRTA
ncbi:MAG: SDR family NAD(P)-dependent oxidoreductase [Pseudomonadota bacterium]